MSAAVGEVDVCRWIKGCDLGDGGRGGERQVRGAKDRFAGKRDFSISADPTEAKLRRY